MKQACGALLLMTSIAANAATKCPAIEASLVGEGFGDGPWRVLSGGQGQCTFMTADTSVNFGFNHMIEASSLRASTAAVQMREAVAATSAIEPMPSLGEEGFVYRPKNDKGEVDAKSMFFYGHRGSVNVSGYLNLGSAITPGQRDFAVRLLAGTLGVASNAKALARHTRCTYIDDALVGKLLPAGPVSAIVPDPNNCVLSADGRVMTLAITKGARGRDTVAGLLRGAGCSVEPLPKFGKAAGVLHHCLEGNARNQVVIADGVRMLEVAYVRGQEPTDEERAIVIAVAEYAWRH